MRLLSDHEVWDRAARRRPVLWATVAGTLAGFGLGFAIGWGRSR